MAVDPSHVATQRLAQLNRQVRLADSEPLTTEELIDMLIPMSPEQRSKLKNVSVFAAPFPLYPNNETELAYFTHDFTDLMPLFKVLALEKLEVTDPYHDCGTSNPYGNEATYSMVEYFVTGLFDKGKGCKELTFRSESDIWLRGRHKSSKPVNNIGAVVWADDGLLDANGHDLCPENPTEALDREVERERPKKELQPMAWDRAIKERDGSDSGACVEMWVKTPTDADGKWKKVGSGGHIPEKQKYGLGGLMVDDNRPGVEIRIRRGEGVDYTEDGIWQTGVCWGEKNKIMLEMFREVGWEDMKKKGLFIPGAEHDPESHL